MALRTLSVFLKNTSDFLKNTYKGIKMCESISSLVPVNKDMVELVCSRLIEIIKKERADILEKGINDTIEYWKKPRFANLWRSKILSREEAKERLDKDYIDNRWVFEIPWLSHRWREEGRAESLLKASKMCEGNIMYLTVSDANLIEKYK